MTIRQLNWLISRPPAMKPWAAAFLVAAVIAAAGCSTWSPPPTALQLAEKIPDCHAFTSDTPSWLEWQEASCTLTDGSLITIGIFLSYKYELWWIVSGGSPDTPNPAHAGCCIRGGLWAATVGPNTKHQPLNRDYQHVTSALGGYVVHN